MKFYKEEIMTFILILLSAFITLFFSNIIGLFMSVIVLITLLYFKPDYKIDYLFIGLLLILIVYSIVKII